MVAWLSWLLGLRLPSSCRDSLSTGLVGRELLAQRCFLPVHHADDLDRLAKSARQGVHS